MPRKKYATEADRIHRNVVKDGNGCWLWQLSVHREGYGNVTVGGRTFLAHRFSYEALVGSIPEGLQLDHLCRVRNCVNPSHLEPVTAQDNILRSPIAPGAINARKTHCPQDHPYDADNTYVIPSTGSRMCRTCQRNRRETLSLRAASVPTEVAA